MTRVLTVVGSPSPRSFAHALAEEVTRALTAGGATARVHDLYAEGFPPVAPLAETRTTGDEVRSDDLVQEHRRDLQAADVLVVAHPNWWGKPPAIMAGWIDRVVVPGVAYRLPTGDGLPVPLLSLQRVVVLNTGDTPAEREAEVFGDPLDLIWRRCVGTYLGAPVARLLAGPVSSATPAQRAQWLSDAAALATTD